MIDFFSRWLGSKNSEPPQPVEPFAKTLDDNFIDRHAYLKWLEDEKALSELLANLKRQYNNYLAEAEEHSLWVDFLESKGANGIMIHSKKYPGDLSKWHFVGEYLKERVLSWGYRLYSSEVRSQGGIRPVVFLRHYLKPPVRNMLTQPIDQIFGNITIELASRDNEAEQLKFQVLHYSDRNYREPRDIEELYRSVFEKD